MKHPFATPGLPQDFGRYHLVKKLGQGGMGSVYEAEDTQLGRRVALKMPYLSSDDDDRKTIERFLREARVAASIDHPNICPVYDVGDVNGTPYLTMPLIHGAPLSKPSSTHEALQVIRKLALALQVMHDRGIIHRDLKPSNIMVKPGGEPVIMDFGLARSCSGSNRLTTTGKPLGTPAYMPPEQISGNPEAMGPGCVIYSLGVILYELATGQLPFIGPPMAVFGQILHGQPSLPSALCPGLNRGFDAICLKAMAKKAEDRYTSMAEFAAAIDGYLRRQVEADPGDELGPRPQPSVAERAVKPSMEAKDQPLKGTDLNSTRATSPFPPPTGALGLKSIASVGPQQGSVVAGGSPPSPSAPFAVAGRAQTSPPPESATPVVPNSPPPQQTEITLGMVSQEQRIQIEAQAKESVTKRLLVMLFGPPAWDNAEEEERHRRVREKMKARLEAGDLEDRLVELTVEEKAVPGQISSEFGREQMDVDFQSILERIAPKRPQNLMPIRDARLILMKQEVNDRLATQVAIEQAVQQTEITLGMVRQEQRIQIEAQAKERVTERLLDMLFLPPAWANAEEVERHRRVRPKLKARLEAGDLEDRLVDLTAAQEGVPGMEKMDDVLQRMFDRILPKQAQNQPVPIRDARLILMEQEVKALVAASHASSHGG
jgi:serine/threonine protein kinase